MMMNKDQKAAIAIAAIKVEIQVLAIAERSTKAESALREYLESASKDSLVRLYDILRIA